MCVCVCVCVCVCECERVCVWGVTMDSVAVKRAHRMEEKKERRSERWRVAGTHRTHTRQLDWVSDLMW